MKTALKNKVQVTQLQAEDFSGVVHDNLATLETSYVVLDERQNKIIVMDGSAADQRIKAAKAGEVVPLGTVTVNEVLYRIYLVSHSLLS